MDKLQEPQFELDNSDERSFCTFFRNLGPKDASTIRVFERKDYFSVHGEDSEYVAQKVYHTRTVIKYLGGSNGVPSCTISPTVFRNFAREALQNGMKLEFWSHSRGREWTLTKQASPGNLQDVEDLLFFSGAEDTSTPVLLSVKVANKAEQKTVGVCFIDPSTRKIFVSEFVDNDLYSNFESLLVQVSAKECLVQTDESGKDYDINKLKSVIDRCGVARTDKRPGEFAPKEIEDDLGKLIESDITVNALPQYDLKVAMGATAALVRYLNLMIDSTNYGRFQLVQYDLSEYMRLDASAVRALNIMPGPNDTKTMSIFGILNHTKTAVGTRLLSQWLKQPLMDKTGIEQRHRLVECFVTNMAARQSLQEDHLRSVPDLYRLAKRLQKGVASLEDVVRVYQLVLRLPGFVETLRDADEEFVELLEQQYASDIAQFHGKLAKFQAMVETTIDLEALARHDYIIKPSFDEDLTEMRQKLERVQESIEEEHDRASEDLNQEKEKKLKLEQHTTYGWCMRLTRTEASAIRGRKEYSELATLKSGVFFTTNALARLSREYQDLNSMYDRQQSSLVREVVSIAASYCPVLERLASVLAHLDVIVSFAHASTHAPYPYVKPKMHSLGQGDTILTESRHPCMELQDDVNYIANDVSLVRDSSSFLIITGPNMGGKSTYIRQIGVIALMAQAGCFVPCATAELCIFDSILARVGAGDSQMRGISTFMAEMLETATILKIATSNSLLIVDELGRGTSTTDGFGLAWAISEHIINKIGAFTLFATHFHELTALAEQSSRVRNLHVVAHVEENEAKTITLLYKVEPGVCDRSFGIHVAELAEFPNKVVYMAKRKAEELEGSDPSDDKLAKRHHGPDEKEGIELIRGILRQWKSCIDPQVDTDRTMMDKFHALVQNETNAPQIRDNTWIQSLLSQAV